jgi:hypothetical protein
VLAEQRRDLGHERAGRHVAFVGGARLAHALDHRCVVAGTLDAAVLLGLELPEHAVERRDRGQLELERRLRRKVEDGWHGSIQAGPSDIRWMTKTPIMADIGARRAPIAQPGPESGRQGVPPRSVRIPHDEEGAVGTPLHLEQLSPGRIAGHAVAVGVTARPDLRRDRGAEGHAARAHTLD